MRLHTWRRFGKSLSMDLELALPGLSVRRGPQVLQGDAQTIRVVGPRAGEQAIHLICGRAHLGLEWRVERSGRLHAVHPLRVAAIARARSGGEGTPCRQERRRARSLVTRTGLACLDRATQCIESIVQCPMGAACRDRDGAAHSFHIVAILADHRRVLAGQCLCPHIFQHRAVRALLTIHVEETVHVVRTESPDAGDQACTRIQQPRAVVGVARAHQHPDLVRLRIDAHFSVMRTGGADGIRRHHMVHNAIATFRDPSIQADRSIGIERLAAQVVVVGTDLRQRTAQRMAGDGDFGRTLSRQLSLLLGVVARPSREGDCVVRLQIGPSQHHRAIRLD